jgi:hypothetical protein
MAKRKGPQTPKKKQKRSFEHRSMSDAALRETRRLIETKLDEVAKLGRRRPNEPPDEPDRTEIRDGKNVHTKGESHYPIERFLASRAADKSASEAVRAAWGPISWATGNRDLDAARAQFAALCSVVIILDNEDGASPVFLEWGGAMKRTRALRKKIDAWRTDVTAIDATINSFVEQSGGLWHSLVPQLPGAIAHLNVSQALDELEYALALAAARVCPDIMNLARRTGGIRTNFSLGRVLFYLAKGWLFGEQGAFLATAFTADQRLDLVVDGKHDDDDTGRDQRYELALARYNELHEELFKVETPNRSSHVGGQDAS